VVQKQQLHAAFQSTNILYTGSEGVKDSVLCEPPWFLSRRCFS